MRGTIARNARRIMTGTAVAVACLGGLPGAGIAGRPAGAAAATRTAAPAGPADPAAPFQFVPCGAGALAEAIAAGRRLLLSRGCVYLLHMPLPVIHGKLYIEGN